jgi:hypothetical protein
MEKDMEKIITNDTLQSASLKSMHKRLDDMHSYMKEIQVENNRSINLVAKGLEETVGALGILKTEFMGHTKEEMARLSVIGTVGVLIAGSLVGFGVWLVTSMTEVSVNMERHTVVIEHILNSHEKITETLENQNKINIELYKAIEHTRGAE